MPFLFSGIWDAMYIHYTVFPNNCKGYIYVMRKKPKVLYR